MTSGSETWPVDEFFPIQPPPAPWFMLGADETLREHRLRMWVVRFYQLLFERPRLLQYFTALLARSNPRIAALMGDGLNRDELADHLTVTLMYVLGRPGIELTADLTRHLVLFNITPGVYFETLGVCLDAGEQVDVGLDVLAATAAAWTSQGVAGSIVRKYAEPELLAQLGVAA